MKCRMRKIFRAKRMWLQTSTPVFLKFGLPSRNTIRAKSAVFLSTHMPAWRPSAGVLDAQESLVPLSLYHPCSVSGGAINSRSGFSSCASSINALRIATVKWMLLFNPRAPPICSTKAQNRSVKARVCGLQGSLLLIIRSRL